MRAIFSSWIVLVLSACGGSGGEEPFFALACLADPDCRQVMVTAHRGYHAHHPENSLAAVRATAELGAEFAEVDVAHTADEVLILMHDDEVDRTTDGTGVVEEMTWAEIRQLGLLDCEAGNSESCQVPRFEDVLALADELGIMLYLDVKTGRTDLVLQAIQQGPFHHVSLVRDDLDKVVPMVGEDEKLLVMPPIGTLLELEAARTAIPALRIVEYASGVPDPDFTAAVKSFGIKVQQDVMAHGDLLGAVGDYSHWKDFIDAGVILLQTDFPQFLVPAVREYNETGVFPEDGPGLF
jgi:glycerophosphoryl diester phosphodiesterase